LYLGQQYFTNSVTHFFAKRVILVHIYDFLRKSLIGYAELKRRFYIMCILPCLYSLPLGVLMQKHPSGGFLAWGCDSWQAFPLALVGCLLNHPL